MIQDRTHPSDLEPYRTPLDRAVSYIRNHYAEEISLDDLAGTACISKFHFHRLFRARFGETARDYLLRVRLEQAAFRISSGDSSSLTDIAYHCGFSSSQQFARAFKAHYGLSPNHVRDSKWNTLKAKMKLLEGSYGKKHVLPSENISGKEILKMIVPDREMPNRQEILDLEVVSMPAYRTAYVRSRITPGEASSGEEWAELFQWAASKELFESLQIAAIWNEPDSNGRIPYDACISIPESFEADKTGEVCFKYLPGGEYGIYHGMLPAVSETVPTWGRLYRGWWMSSYFARDRRPCYELFYNNGALHPKGTWFVDFCLPVTTLPR